MTKLFSYLVYGFLWLLSFLPLRVLYMFSDVVYLFIYHLIGYRKKVVNKNLWRAFPEKNQKQIKQIRREFYRHFCDLFMETIKLWHMNSEQIKKRCLFLNPQLLNEYLNRGKSVIVILGHYGNWEWPTSYALHTSFDFLPIYKPLHNKMIDKMYIEIRERFGAKTLPKKETLRTMIRYQRENRPTITAFLGDQTPNRHNLNYWTSFLNQDTPILLGTEKIAKKLDQVVVYANMQKIKRGYYQIEMITLFDNPQKTKPFDITEKHTRILEDIIRKKPSYWLWSHKRWKHKRPSNHQNLS